MATLPSGDTSRRIVTLDIIRGIAVMGIFSVNITAFAMIEGAYFNPPAYGGADGANLALWVANLIFVDGKMRSLFSMLFGASMLLVIQRAEANGESGAKIHYARMAVLFAIGWAHYHLLWWGDILKDYAFTGCLAFFWRRASVKRLIGWAIGLYVFGMLFFGSFLVQVLQWDQAAHAANASKDVIANWNDFARMVYPTSADIAKDLALHRGSWLGIAHHWVIDKPFSWVQGTFFFLPETLALMLFGMAGFKSGFLTGEWDNRRYRKWAVVGLSLGALASIVLAFADIQSRFYAPLVFGGFIVGLAPFRLVMAAGYAALIILLTRNLGWLAQRIAATGRAAFTNYLGTSLIATFVFYGWGLGYYGSAQRWQAWLLVPTVWAIMLLWSKPWLEHFHYGPLEWLWRTLARGKVQPLRKRRPAEAAATA
jgi:uncharacterized protein